MSGTFVTVLFTLLVLGFIAFYLLETGIFPNSVLFFLGYVALMTYLALSGDLNSQKPFLLAIPIGTFLCILAFQRDPAMKRLISAVSPDRIIAIQAYRIMPEIMILFFIADRVLPDFMSFTGRNFDIVTALSAVPVAFLFAKRKIKPGIAILWNLAGITILAVTVINGLLSTVQLNVIHGNVPNTAVLTWPGVYLPSVFVVIAFTLHIWSIRTLLSRRKTAIA